MTAAAAEPMKMERKIGNGIVIERPLWVCRNKHDGKTHTIDQQTGKVCFS